jgi:hypothetical protein
MKKAILIIAAVLFLGGVIHIGLTPLLYGGLTLNALWYSSAGLALMFAACINYLVITATPWQARFFAVGHLSNILGSVLLGLILLFLPAPHVALLFLLVVAETVLVIWSQVAAARSGVAVRS